MSSFSDAIVCRFRLRPLTIEADRPAFAYGPEESELVFSLHLRGAATGRGRRHAGPGRRVHLAVRRDGPLPRARRAGRARGRPARLRRPALGPVLHRPAGLHGVAQDRAARLQGAGAEQPGRRERPGRRRRGRLRAAAPAHRDAAARRGRRDGGRRQAPDPHRAVRPRRDQERHHVDEGVRPGQSRSGDPRPLQPGRRLPHEQGLPRRLPRPAERQPRRDRPPGRQDGLAARPGRRPPADRAAARRLPGGGRLQAVRRGQLLRDRTGGAAGTPARDVRGPLAERPHDGHHLHAARQRRQRAAHQRRRGPGDGAGVRRLPLHGAAQSAPARPPTGDLIARVRQQAGAPKGGRP